eukprot:CCRYP_019736-RF/>CCRYP_019736-RF protein AED:0.45 eAED:0.45 QI:0/-1/0/1/-1/0/1/0/39
MAPSMSSPPFSILLQHLWQKPNWVPNLSTPKKVVLFGSS